MKGVIPNKSEPSRFIAALLLIQSFSIVGLFSTHHFPHFVRVLGSDLQNTLTVTTDAAAVMIAVALALIARGISLRRRRAWQLATALQSLLLAIAAIHNAHRYFTHPQTSEFIFRNFETTHLLFEISLLVLLIVKRKSFNTLTDPHTRKGDLYYFIRIAFISYIVAIVIVFFDRDRFVTRLSNIQIFETALKGLVGISGPVAFSMTNTQERVENLLLGLGLLIAITTIFRMLRPIERVAHLSNEDKKAMSELITKYPSDDSLAYFALRDDKDVIWAKNGKAAIAYSVINGVMIASGDPLGDSECWPAAISAFMAEAQSHAWIPGVYGCTERAGEIWRREIKCDALEIGDEAVVLVNDFNIETPQLKSVRQMVNKARKEGYVAQSKKISELSYTERVALSRLAQEWRRGGDERGFSMALGRFCDDQDPDAVVTWASSEGEYKGLLQFVPWGKDGLSLDLMRRSKESISGINELLIATTIEYAKFEGISRISLNFATFRSIFEKGERLGAGPITRINHKILILLSRFVQMESLYRFNSKFQPVWEPRYILFPSIGHLGRVAIAILRIESFLPGKNKRVAAIGGKS